MVVYCENMPLSIIYPGELLENATVEDQRLVIDTLKTYLDRSNKIESIVYSIEMPSVLLLAKEGKLSSEDKIKVGKIMGYDYLILPEIMRNDKNFEININVYDLKKGRMQSYGAITRVEPSKFDSDIIRIKVLTADVFR